MSASPAKSSVPRTCPPLVVLAGNPNCGKTSLFNSMTGLRYKVANYPGVTVEKREALLALPDQSQIRLVDLPGMYSLDGGSLDEVIAANAVQGRCAGESTPDVIISIADSTNLERCLLLTTQLIDIGKPVILALNMADLAEKQGLSLKTEILSQRLGIPVYTTSAVTGRGIKSMLTALQNTLQHEATTSASHGWPKDLAGRFSWIESLLEKAVVKTPQSAGGLYRTLDALSTHRIFGPAIFLMIMAFIFQAIYSWASLPMDAIEHAISWLGQFLSSILPEGQLKGLVIDGVVAGVGSIIIFVPQIAILFFFHRPA